MNEKILIETNVSIMVNNLCNMTCSHCTGLAMYDFLGTFKWTSYEEYYKEWAKILDLKYISLCGGEPYLHPELELWFDNVRQLWPDARLEILTNGTRLAQRKELSRKFVQDQKTWIQVSCHDESTFEKQRKDVLDILSPWMDRVTTIEKEKVHLKEWKMIEYYLDGRIAIRLQQVTEMAPPYHKTVENGIVYFEMGGDQEASHQNCAWKDTYTFQNGRLYKCPPVTNYPEAKLQIRYEPEAQEVLEKYKGCNPFDEYELIKEFVQRLPESIPVCKLCAFDKQKDTLCLSIPVTLDASRKKKFRQFKITPVTTP